MLYQFLKSHNALWWYSRYNKSLLIIAFLYCWILPGTEIDVPSFYLEVNDLELFNICITTLDIFYIALFWSFMISSWETEQYKNILKDVMKLVNLF